MSRGILRWNKEKRIALYTSAGEPELADLISLVDIFYEKCDTQNILCDLRNSSLRRIRLSEVNDVIERITIYYSGKDVGKAAIVVSDDLSMGMARMFEMKKEPEHPKITTMVFRDIDAAWEWLGINPEPLEFENVAEVVAINNEAV